jgi:hypothetical protein
MLLGHRAAWTDVSCQVQPVVRRGDRVGDRQIKAEGYFAVSALNDRGQILFLADSADGNQMLVQYAGNRLIPIAAAGEEGPGRHWGQGQGGIKRSPSGTSSGMPSSTPPGR